LSSCSARSASARSKGRPFADADILQRLGQGFGVELLQTDEADVAMMARSSTISTTTLLLDLDAHVLEQPGGKQRTQRRRALLVVVLSPMRNGKLANTVPGSVRCRPSTRMSRS
jgi:hypothetical protein